MEQEYKSNSHKSKELANAEEKRVKKPVVSGKVLVKKKTPAEKIFSTFISEDIDDVGSYVLTKIFVPAIKELISSMVGNGVNMLLFGEGGVTPANYKLANHTHYASYYQNAPSPKAQRQAQMQSRMASERYDINTICFATSAEAEAVIASMIDLIDEYGHCTVADFYELCELSSKFTDRNFGWYNISSASVKPSGKYYRIVLPAPTVVD